MQGGARGAAWCALTLFVLLWPAKIAGPLDGAPLDGGVEAIALGLVVPVLCWFYGGFFRTRVAKVLIVAIALLRIADAQFTQGGFCVRFDPQRQIVRDQTGKPHSWDVRADWRSPDPQCSAVMTEAWTTFKRFPVWFFNLAPPDNNLPTPDDRPPYTTLKMTVVGYLDVKEAGSLDLQVGKYSPTTLVVGGRSAEASGEASYRIDVAPGLHLLQADTTLGGNEWHFNASFNQQPFGSAGFPLMTIERPRSLDRSVLRSVVGWLSTALIGGFVLVWIIGAIRAWGDVPSWAWALIASACLAYLAPRPGNEFIVGGLAKWSVTALAFAALVPLREQLRTVRGAFVLIGIPWLVFIAVGAFDHLAKFSFYAGGDDQWTFQRFAYRIYLQGYFLEGGEPTFWFQPGYRWIAGALHMVFGDSSLGEFHWDGICLAIIAMFAFEVVRRTAGFRFGVIAGAVVLGLVMHGPPLLYWGSGLSENAAAGFIYGAALAAMFADNWKLRVAAGVLATLGFYVRLNNLPLAFAIAVLAIPADVRARDAWSPRVWLARVNVRTALTVVGVVAVGMLLFTLRTWYYTGSFSFFAGTTMNVNSIYQPGMPIGELARRMIDSAWMVLSMNDPPRFAWYATPLIVAPFLAIGSLVGIPRLRDVPLSLVLFFLASISGALVARGVAYSGRFSTIVIGSATAVTIAAIAAALNSKDTKDTKSSWDPAKRAPH
jgi:hypothetical protein